MQWERRKYEKFNEKGQSVFGRVTLTGRSCVKEKNYKYIRFVEGECTCGVTRWFRYELLAKGETKSCGCLRKEVAGASARTHGLTNHPLYHVWAEMKMRCSNPNNKSFKNYGDRGICICDEWYNSFEEFYLWAIENGWKEGLHLDREENSGNYEPNNCRFVSRGINNRNTRVNRNITAFGETKCMLDWSKDERCKVSFGCLRSRIDRDKWTDMEKAITEPQIEKAESQRRMKSNRNFTAFGETKCMTAWLEDSRCLVKIDSFRDRLAKGWDAEKVMSTPPTRDGKNTK